MAEMGKDVDYTAISLLLITVVIWSINFVFIKIGLEEFPPITLATLRFLFAFPLLLAACILTKSGKLCKPRLKELPTFVLLAMTGVTLFFILYFNGMKYVTTTMAAIIVNVNPIFIAILSRVILKEPLGKRKTFGMLLAFLGVALVVSQGRLSLGELSPSVVFGSLLILSASFLWAIYSIVGKMVVLERPPLETTTIVFGLGALCLIPFSFLESPFRHVLCASWRGWISVLYMAFLSSALTYVLWYMALARIEAVKAAVFLYLIPLLVMAVAHFFLGEEITPASFFGCILVIVGLFITESA